MNGRIKMNKHPPLQNSHVQKINLSLYVYICIAQMEYQNKNQKSKANHRDPQPTLLTPSLGTKSSVCAVREKFPFRWNDLSAFCSSVVGTPPWVMPWISIRSPLRFQTLSKSQKQTNSLLRHAKCCHTCAATVKLLRPPLKLGYSQNMWCRQ